ncbi:MAG: sigma-70 family RNA polymerase sigma factor [Bacteroidota bacterium]|nr:sigma-70 family RNA polymerase sigma factor [Bacteroidota bacterium]
MNNYTSLTDLELVNFVVDHKDTDAFGVIYDRYASKVYNKCIQIVHAKDVVEDLTHDIFLKIYINLKKFKQEAKLSTWIYSITYNFCIDYLRRNKKNNNDIDLETISEESSSENDDILLLKEECLKDILQEISAEERMILLMKYQDEMSLKEIMNVLSIKESAVKM